MTLLPSEPLRPATLVAAVRQFGTGCIAKFDSPAVHSELDERNPTRVTPK